MEPAKPLIVGVGTSIRSGLRRTFTDIIAGRNITASATLLMQPCQFMVLVGGRR